MLTLGAEYEDTWAPPPDRRESPGQRTEEEQGLVEGADADTCSDDPEGPSWRAVDTDTVQKYDAVLHLDGLSRPEQRDGVRQIVRRHEALHSTPWTRA